MEHIMEEAKLLRSFSYDFRRLLDFLRHKEEHRAVLSSPQPGEERERVKSELSSLLVLEHRWKRYPEWYLSMRAQLRDLQEFRPWAGDDAGSRDGAVNHRPPVEPSSSASLESTPPHSALPAAGVDAQPVDVHYTVPPISAGFSAETQTGASAGSGLETALSVASRPESPPRSPHCWSIDDIDRFYEQNGFVGERQARTLLVYGALGGAHLGIESLSGAGKSALLYTFLKLLPRESYLILKRSTDKALFNDPDINTYRFLVVTELQKIQDGLKEDIKDLTEGVDSVYRRTNRNKDGVDVLTVSSGKNVIYTLAITNDYFRKKDNELSRRFIVLPTGISREQNIAVADAFAEQAFVQDAEQSEHRGGGKPSQLGSHLAECLSLNGESRNPFLGYILSRQPEEITGNVRYRSFVKHLQKLVGGCTRFHHAQRVRGESGMFAMAQDNQEIMELYGPLFYDNVVGISVVDRLMLDSLETGCKYQHRDALERIAQQGFYDRTAVIEDSFQHLADLRFLSVSGSYIEKVKDRGQGPALDWGEAQHSADGAMKEHYPQYWELWMERGVGMKRSVDLERCRDENNKSLSGAPA